MAGVTGRTALVTGAGSPNGIGFATARLLLAAGAKVAITSTTDRIFERLAELRADASTTFAQPADLTKADDVAGLVAAVTARLGSIDILVNNAGMTQVRGDVPAGPLQGMTETGWDYGIDINLKTAFLVTRQCCPGWCRGVMGASCKCHPSPGLWSGLRAAPSTPPPRPECWA